MDDDTPQPEFGGENEEETMEEEVAMDVVEEDDKDLDEDDLRSYHKVNSVKTISSLRMKPDHLF